MFCDVTGSTALGESKDPEALRALLARYFERMKGIVEAHGGTVEKFIGDAVMAVFGVPVLHEDDALRACRAAVEMRDAFPELGINLTVLEPGRLGSLYHAEGAQENFLVLSGTCLLLIEGEERKLRTWDFVHCPPDTAHTFVAIDELAHVPATGPT